MHIFLLLTMVASTAQVPTMPQCHPEPQRADMPVLPSSTSAEQQAMDDLKKAADTLRRKQDEQDRINL